MATIIGAYEAKTRFSELLTRVEAGEEITITRRDRVVARLVPGETSVTRAERVEKARQRLNALHAAMPNRRRPDDLATPKDLIEEGQR